MSRGIPSSAELLEAVRELVRDEILPSLAGALAFEARVAVNILAIVERELQFGADNEAAHAQRLRSLCVQDDADLARAIRAGSFDDRLPELVSALHQQAVDRLRVDNPRYLLAEDLDRMVRTVDTAKVM
jgi:hypothetical protein